MGECVLQSGTALKHQTNEDVLCEHVRGKLTAARACSWARLLYWPVPVVSVQTKLIRKRAKRVFLLAPESGGRWNRTFLSYLNSDSKARLWWYHPRCCPDTNQLNLTKMQSIKMMMFKRGCSAEFRNKIKRIYFYTETMCYVKPIVNTRLSKGTLCLHKPLKKTQTHLFSTYFVWKSGHEMVYIWITAII